MVANQAGGTAYEQVHLPFGTALNAESSLTTNNKRFTSYDRSSATGLDYAINRTYDSKQGRFTTVDPIGMQAVSLVSPQTLNMYTYCGNDPINYTDPSGLFIKKLFKWIAKALKWIAIVVVVAFVVISSIWAPGSTGFVAKLMLGMLDFLSKVGSILGFASGGLIAASEALAAWQIGLLGIIGAGTAGAIAEYQTRDRKKKVRKKPQRATWCPPLNAAQTFFRTLQQFRTYEKAVQLTQDNNEEQGGWIYQDRSGNVTAVLKNRDTQWDLGDSADSIVLGNPPPRRGMRVVGTFHVHRGKGSLNDIDANPSGYEHIAADGSISASADYAVNRIQQVPGLLLRKSDGGYTMVVYGPSRGVMNVGIPKGCGRKQ